MPSLKGTVQHFLYIEPQNNVWDSKMFAYQFLLPLKSFSFLYLDFNILKCSFNSKYFKKYDTFLGIYTSHKYEPNLKQQFIMKFNDLLYTKVMEFIFKEKSMLLKCVEQVCSIIVLFNHVFTVQEIRSYLRYLRVGYMWAHLFEHE